MDLGAFLALSLLVLMTPVGVLTGIAVVRVERWWALTSDRRALRRIGKLQQQLDRLQTVRLYQMLIPLGGFILLVINTVTLMIGTAYVSLLVDLRAPALHGSTSAQVSLITRLVRLAPLIIGAAVNLYATWFVRRFAVRLPAYKARIEREIAMLRSSLSPLSLEESG